MADIHGITKANTAGGVLDSVLQNFVTVNGELVSVDGSLGTSHPPCPSPTIHCSHQWVTTSGATWYTINGIPVNRTGDPDSCGHPRDVGFPFFQVIGP